MLFTVDEIRKVSECLTIINEEEQDVILVTNTTCPCGPACMSAGDSYGSGEVREIVLPLPNVRGDHLRFVREGCRVHNQVTEGNWYARL